MSRTATLTMVTALVVAGIALSGCATASPPYPASPSLASTAIPTPAYQPELPELPEWARDSTPWLIYPDGFECGGTEGCPNDYRALIGEPGTVLPVGVEYYDPATHDCVVVSPLGMDCFG